MDIRGGEFTGLCSRIHAHLAYHAGDRALSVGACHMDKAQAVLWVAEFAA